MTSENSDDIEKQKELINTSFEQNKSYTNIIIFAGYAGLFSVWTLTKENLVHWQVLIVGLLTIISLMIFICFELYGAWLRGTQLKDWLDQLSKTQSEDNSSIDDFNKKLNAQNTTYLKIWPYFFFSSAITAIIAAIILIYSFISGLY